MNCTESMRLKDIVSKLEQLAPLALQEEYDNSGLQLGDPEMEVTGVLVCLDVTEPILSEAEKLGANVIVSHHPLIFRPLRHITGSSYQERIVIQAIKKGIAIYSSHTCLDNAPGGVNHRMASILGLSDLEWLQPKRVQGYDCGSGLIGTLAAAVDEAEFLSRVKDLFKVECLKHNAVNGRVIRRVALCGGAGAFLLRDAVAAGADCFITGELHYHDYFGHEPWAVGSDDLLLVETGHYQSERHTIALLRDTLVELPELTVHVTAQITDPIQCLHTS